MRTSRYVGGRLVAAALGGVALLCATTACASSGRPAASGRPAKAGTTASASAQHGPLDSLSADQIASRATADLKVVKSVHVAGTATSSGQVVNLNLTLGTRGCTGTMGIKGEGSFILLKVGKTLWIKPDDAFWKHAVGGDATSTVMSLLSGKYIKPSAKGSSLASIGSLCNPTLFATSFGGNMTGMVKGAATTIAGQPALQIKDTADPASAYVTVSAHPEFLRLAGGGGNGQLDFSKYNAPLHLAPPPSSEVLNGAKYGF